MVNFVKRLNLYMANVMRLVVTMQNRFMMNQRNWCLVVTVWERLVMNWMYWIRCYGMMKRVGVMMRCVQHVTG